LLFAAKSCVMERHAQNGKKIGPALKNLRNMRKAFCMAQEMGARLG
jgi:hypothetical protein